jgi:hypothetical protein
MTTCCPTRRRDPSITPYYSVVAISRLGFLSDASAPLSTGELPVNVENDVPPAAFALESIYPNPTSDRLSIRVWSDAGRAAELRIVDALGRSVYRRDLITTAGQSLVNVSTRSFPSGLYVVELRSGRERVRATVVVAR